MNDFFGQQSYADRVKVVYCKLVGNALRHCSVNECLVVEEGGVAAVCVYYTV